VGQRIDSLRIGSRNSRPQSRRIGRDTAVVKLSDVGRDLFADGHVVEFLEVLGNQV
jgi:hypothetical protein